MKNIVCIFRKWKSFKIPRRFVLYWECSS